MLISFLATLFFLNSALAQNFTIPGFESFTIFQNDLEEKLTQLLLTIGANNKCQSQLLQVVSSFRNETWAQNSK